MLCMMGCLQVVLLGLMLLWRKGMMEQLCDQTTLSRTISFCIACWDNIVLLCIVQQYCLRFSWWHHFALHCMMGHHCIALYYWTIHVILAWVLSRSSEVLSQSLCFGVVVPQANGVKQLKATQCIIVSPSSSVSSLGTALRSRIVYVSSLFIVCIIGAPFICSVADLIVPLMLDNLLQS